jgi:hypothetical protein
VVDVVIIVPPCDAAPSPAIFPYWCAAHHFSARTFECTNMVHIYLMEISREGKKWSLPGENRRIPGENSVCRPFFAGTDSAIIPVRMAHHTRRKQTARALVGPPIHLGDLHGNDSRRSVENGKRQRSQIR